MAHRDKKKSSISNTNINREELFTFLAFFLSLDSCIILSAVSAEMPRVKALLWGCGSASISRADLEPGSGPDLSAELSGHSRRTGGSTESSCWVVAGWGSRSFSRASEALVVTRRCCSTKSSTSTSMASTTLAADSDTKKTNFRWVLSFFESKVNYFFRNIGWDSNLSAAGWRWGLPVDRQIQRSLWKPRARARSTRCRWPLRSHLQS